MVDVAAAGSDGNRVQTCPALTKNAQDVGDPPFPENTPVPPAGFVVDDDGVGLAAEMDAAFVPLGRAASQ